VAAELLDADEVVPPSAGHHLPQRQRLAHDRRRQWPVAIRAVMILLSTSGTPRAQIAALA
jgi:hypothetical protein